MDMVKYRSVTFYAPHSATGLSNQFKTDRAAATTLQLTPTSTAADAAVPAFTLFLIWIIATVASPLVNSGAGYSPLLFSIATTLLFATGICVFLEVAQIGRFFASLSIVSRNSACATPKAVNFKAAYCNKQLAEITPSVIRIGTTR